MEETSGVSHVIDGAKKPPCSPKPTSLQTQIRKNSDSKKPNPIHLLTERLDEQDRIINKLVADVNKKDVMISSLEKRLLKIEAEQVKTESLLFIKDNVSRLLSKRINNLEQYTRRYSVVVKGIEYERNEKYDSLKEQVIKIIEQANSQTTFDDVDKFHRNGPRNGTKQDMIIRFKSHSAKENFYNKRKTIKLERVKVQPSLSPETKKLLSEANDFIDTFKSAPDAYHNCPDFVFADIHGNLLVKMAERTDDGMFFRFDSLEHLSKIIQTENCDNDANAAYDDTKAVYEVDDEEEEDVDSRVSISTDGSLKIQ